MATVQEAGEELQRQDFCTACWQAAPAPTGAAGPLGVWRARVPAPHEKKKLFVDDELLINFFQRLGETDDPARISFRFVLALVLMRKKLLVYDHAEKAPDREIWVMHLRGSDQRQEVVDPHLDEEKIAEVSQHLGEILEGDL